LLLAGTDRGGSQNIGRNDHELFRPADVAGHIGNCCALIGGSASPSFAEHFPERSVKIIGPFGPGGSLDVIARLVAEQLGKTWSQPVVVENRRGANGIIGVDALMKAPADGYTILFATSRVFTTNKLLHKNPPYDPDKGFIPVSLAAVARNVLGIIRNCPLRISMNSSLMRRLIRTKRPLHPKESDRRAS
jgi:tripartite-type tricarboxylate transporter receptor subunit TctC